MTALTWDEPTGCHTARGWLSNNGTCVGFYLDYGPDHYRIDTHTHMWRQYGWSDPVESVRCDEQHPCRECQPGNILAVAYPNGPGTGPKESRYCETVEQARQYVTGITQRKAVAA